MVSFLHTSDWQLGQTLSSVGPDKAEELRAARLRTVRRVLELARDLDVDFVVSAGDGFESNQVGRGLLEKTAKLLAEYGDVPLYVVPGNHDPLMEDYAFDSDVMRSAGEHVHVLKEEEPVEVPETSAVIYPGIPKRKKSSRNPLEWVPSSGDSGRIRIGLAHGSWKILPDLPKDDYPIEEDAADTLELDYLALGHWHSTLPDPETDSGRTFYSGTPEPTGFGESDSGNVLEVEIGSFGSSPDVEKRSVAEYEWMEREVELSDAVSVESLRDELLSGETRPEKTLLRLEPEGAVSLEVRREYQELMEELEEEFYFLDTRDENLILTPTEDEIGELGSGTGWLKSAVDYLKAVAAGETTEPPESWKMEEPPTAEEAGRALQLVYGRIREEEG